MYLFSPKTAQRQLLAQAELGNDMSWKHEDCFSLLQLSDMKGDRKSPSPARTRTRQDSGGATAIALPESRLLSLLLQYVTWCCFYSGRLRSAHHFVPESKDIVNL